ncbi:MBL fold metallo-hydrolase RNA specificity domain-containing protein [Pseudomaricurvus sp. HS19]|uniref:MBL fold metallo-hydrolase RNA specificity domain-containing protein n=1 Tax=Pseudomaricurvus sp. HS19 TaxID=2692626 RepID=UPI0013712C43|nr:MBL fold metallo-hydrolase [Pseudomaricurvus sp. HS19]MYM62854.1 MBL fold metallo-hydrolase [Pseudomaricurvus sp. HS19]
MITIQHHGAFSGVTGSCHELSLGDAEERAGILVDCGLFQGRDGGHQASANNLAIDFSIAHIRALVVTHVHIDHVGRIPYLLAAGFRGPIICSRPSAIMLPEILEDALRIGFTRDRRLIERVLGAIRSRIVPLAYNQWHEVFAEEGRSLAVRLQRAGHILGSAYVECDAQVSGSTERVVFSGDLGAPHAPLLPEPQSPERADRLVIESTYGDRDHESREDRRYRLKRVLENALSDGGTVLIPAFSIGRTQDLLYEIEGLIAEFGDKTVGDSSLPWKELAVVVDSPLAAEFTRIYRQLKPYWDEEARELVESGRHPLSFEQMMLVNSHDDHLRVVHHLARSGRPCVVIAGSGMCAGGRVVNYLKALLGDKRNDVLFVGYQAAGTPGRDILTYGPRHGWVELDGERYTINARVHQVGGYSAHAGRSDLLRFVRGIPVAPREIRVVHGEDEAREAFKDALREVGIASELV